MSNIQFVKEYRGFDIYCYDEGSYKAEAIDNGYTMFGRDLETLKRRIDEWHKGR